MKVLIFVCVSLILLTCICTKFHDRGYRVLSVMDLPKDPRFYNAKIRSHYELSYVFFQKRFLGMVFASDYRNGSYALLFDNPSLHPYLLSDYELVQFLTDHEIPNLVNPPTYPIYEYPLLFYLGLGCVGILFIKILVVLITGSIKLTKMATKKSSSQSLACSVSYLRRKS